MVRKAAYVLLFMMAAVLFSGNAYSGESFQKVYDNLDLRKSTKLHVKEYWKEMEGKEVSWSGIVHDVQGGRGKARVLVANKTRPLLKGFNVILIVYDIEKAAKLKRGQAISFKGLLHDFKAGRHGGVVMTLNEAQLR